MADGGAHFDRLSARKDAPYPPYGLGLPYKKTKNHSLSEEEKQFNKNLASERIMVENSLSGMKRYQILSNRLRIHAIDFYDKLLGVCAGIWSFYLSN